MACACFIKQTGSPLWSDDNIKDVRQDAQLLGQSCSPGEVFQPVSSTPVVRNAVEPHEVNDALDQLFDLVGRDAAQGGEQSQVLAGSQGL